ncbi:MAG: ATP-binding protein [Actinomycetota bacterium]
MSPDPTSDPTAEAAPGRLVFEIPARTDFVSFARVVVASAAELRPDIASERIEDLKLAVSEAVTNAINAQARVGREERIRLECHVDDDEITVVIQDHGGGFGTGDVPDLPEPDHPDRLLHESGLGLHLMSMLTDESEVSADDDGTDVKLVVYSTRRRRRG